MQVETTPLAGVLLIKPTIYNDNRGFFYEGYQAEKYFANGITVPFVQDNISRSKKGVLRGLHYQLQKSQDKLVSVIRGQVFDVVVDVRQGSPTFGQWFSQILSDENAYQLFIPKGFAHGFCVMSEFADFMYKVSDYYYPQGEKGIHWNDPQLQINWPVDNPLLSTKDEANSLFKTAELPIYGT